MHLAIYDAPEQIEAIWRRLEAQARPTYTLSWGWIENWLASRVAKPSLAVVLDDAGDPIAAAFDDMPVLRAPGFPTLGVASDELRVVVDREVALPHVDLETVRAVEGGYIATRPALVRAHLRHSQRQIGHPELEIATDAARAHQVFDELLALAGAHDDRQLRRLIDQRAPFREIELLRVHAGGVTLGCFYDVVLHGRVAYKAAAFASRDDADLCHVAAIEHAAAGGHAFYELAPADARLATGESRQVVLCLERRAPGILSRLAG